MRPSRLSGYEFAAAVRRRNLTRRVANKSVKMYETSACALALLPATGNTSSVTAAISSPKVVLICFLMLAPNRWIEFFKTPDAESKSNHHARNKN